MASRPGATARTVLALGRRSRQRDIHTKTVAVRLLQPVPGLGEAHDIVHVKPGRMRTALHGQGKAVYLPWKRQLNIDQHVQRHEQAQRDAMIEVTPITLGEDHSVKLPSSRTEPDEDEIAALKDRVDRLPTYVVLPARTIGPTANLFGSVALSDIRRTLNLPDDISLTWSEAALASGKVLNAERVRELGEYDVVAGPGRKISISIVPQEVPV